jgi:hypothetical protein
MKTVDPFEQFLDDESDQVGASPPPIFAPKSLMMAPIPEASEENLICLRGPCRNYMEIVQRFDVGNTIGTLTQEPRLTNRFCRIPNSSDIDLTDSCVYACSHWDPIDPDDSEYKLREERRRKCLDGHGTNPE